MIPLSALQLAAFIDAHLTGDATATFTRVFTDSRAPVGGGLFFALRGERFDGHDYLAAVVASGTGGVVVERGRAPAGCPVVFEVDDTLAALTSLGACLRRAHRGRFIAVTGSVGKTTAKDMIAAALGAFGKVGKTSGNLNNHIGVPLTLCALDGDEAFVVVELGMSAPGEIAALAAITRPDVGLVTRAAAAHLAFFRDVDGIADAKAELYQVLARDSRDSLAVANADDPRMLARARALVPEARLVTYGRDASEQAAAPVPNVPDVRHVHIIGAVHAAGQLVVSLAVGADSFEVTVNAIGLHNADNVAAAIAACLALDVDLRRAAAALSAGFMPAKHRMQLVRRGDLTVLDDCYNANPASTRAALDAFADVTPQLAPTDRLAVLGSMRELGATADDLHADIGARAASVAATVIATGPHAQALATSARDAGALVLAADDVHSLLPAIADWARSHRAGAVLLKGSRGERLERVLDVFPAAAATAVPVVPVVASSDEGGR